MASWDVFLPDVLVHVPAAPDPLVHQALIRAAREFCARSRIYRQWCATVEATAPVYNITLPTDTQAVRLERATVDGVAIDVTPFQWPERDWVTYAAEEDPGVITDDLTTVTVTGETITGTLQLEISLMPTRSAATVSSFLAERYLECIAAGAAFRLLTMRGAPWYDPQAAAIPAAEWKAGIGKACVDASKMHTNRMRKPLPIWC